MILKYEAPTKSRRDKMLLKRVKYLTTTLTTQKYFSKYSMRFEIFTQTKLLAGVSNEDNFYS